MRTSGRRSRDPVASHHPRRRLAFHARAPATQSPARGWCLRHRPLIRPPSPPPRHLWSSGRPPEPVAQSRLRSRWTRSRPSRHRTPGLAPCPLDQCPGRTVVASRRLPHPAAPCREAGRFLQQDMDADRAAAGAQINFISGHPSGAECAPQKRPHAVQRLWRGLQQGDVGGEDMDHALPNVDVARGLVRRLCECMEA